MLAACLLNFVILGGLLMIASPLASAKAQFDPFDSYGAISWELEKAHLDNFAIALQHDPDSIGYIIVYAGRPAGQMKHFMDSDVNVISLPHAAATVTATQFS